MRVGSVCVNTNIFASVSFFFLRYHRWLTESWIHIILPSWIEPASSLALVIEMSWSVSIVQSKKPHLVMSGKISYAQNVSTSRLSIRLGNEKTDQKILKKCLPDIRQR